MYKICKYKAEFHRFIIFLLFTALYNFIIILGTYTILRSQPRDWEVKHWSKAEVPGNHIFIQDIVPKY